MFASSFSHISVIYTQNVPGTFQQRVSFENCVILPQLRAVLKEPFLKCLPDVIVKNYKIDFAMCTVYLNFNMLVLMTVTTHFLLYY